MASDKKQGWYSKSLPQNSAYAIFYDDFRICGKVKLAGRKPGGWTVILGTGCFDAGINLFISLITLHFPTVFIALDGRYDRGGNYRWCNF
jgi:hypothetical protein